MNVTSLSERYFREKSHLKAALDAWEDMLRPRALEIDANAQVSGRVKSYRSFLSKAYWQAGTVRPWEDFGDLVALKAIFPTTEGVTEFTEWLNGQCAWSPVLDKKTGRPNELKYRSMQFDLVDKSVCDSSGFAVPVEVQVRTAVVDAWYVVDHRLKYKGILELPDELQRKLDRLIVFTEIFDEEVQAVVSRQQELPEYGKARLYEVLVSLSASALDGHIRSLRPEGLLEILLGSFNDSEIPALPDELPNFVNHHKAGLKQVIQRHQYESKDFVETRDWLYYEPEVLLIAERAVQRPSLLRSAIEGSEFESVITPMISEFQRLRASG